MRRLWLSGVALILAGCAPFNKQLSLGPWAGRQSPPIEGNDALGHAVSLSDYRGKVVLVSFWQST